MRFTTTLVAVLASSSLAVGAVLQPRAYTSAQLITALNSLISQSEKLQPVISSIQTSGTVLGKRQSNPFQPLIDGYGAIINSVNADIQNLDGSKPYTTADAQAICTAYHNFVAINRETLSLTIGKSGLLEGIFQGPIAAVLRQLETSYDTLSFGVIENVPVCEATATSDKESLDTYLGNAVCAYTPGGTLGLDLFC